MDLFTAIDTRASALKLCEPAPSHEHLLRILQAGGRAPDHGKLAPWRFVVIQGAARDAIGELMGQRLLERNLAATSEELQRERRKVLRAPCIIVAAATIEKPHKVPEIEQVLAVGAAVQNMFLTAHALGYGAMWKTGAPAYDSAIKKLLGLSVEDHIVALLYLGSIEIAGAQRPSVLDERVWWLE
ncbi:MAG: nitroreductase [Steroidobacteraceae bacterium]